MKTKPIRLILTAVAYIALSVCLIAGVCAGTFSSLGPNVISTICPLGAIETMIASHTMIPRGLISIVVLGLIVLLTGRAFCAWLCPVNLWNRIKDFFRSPKERRRDEQLKHDVLMEVAELEIGCRKGCAGCASGCSEAAADALAPKAPEAGELPAKPERPVFDSRHGILLGAVLSTAIFGFPVFCLVCPVGLSFATALLVWRLFAFGDATITVVLVPALLILELVFMRKWCSRFCPLSALMNLVGHGARAWRPIIDDAKCLETSQGVPCSKCAMVCEYDINLRHLAAGEQGLADCTRCRACVESCPAHAITMPFLFRAKAGTRAEMTVSAVEGE